MIYLKNPTDGDISTESFHGKIVIKAGEAVGVVDNVAKELIRRFGFLEEVDAPEVVKPKPDPKFNIVNRLAENSKLGNVDKIKKEFEEQGFSPTDEANKNKVKKSIKPKIKKVIKKQDDKKRSSRKSKR